MMQKGHWRDECAGSKSMRLRQQAFIKHVQTIVQAFDHPQAQGSLAVQDLRNSTTRTDIGFQILWSQPLLLHAKFDRRDRIVRSDWTVPVLIGFDQSDQDLHFIRFRQFFGAPGKWFRDARKRCAARHRSESAQYSLTVCTSISSYRACHNRNRYRRWQTQGSSASNTRLPRSSRPVSIWKRIPGVGGCRLMA